MPAEHDVNGAVGWLWDMEVALGHRSPRRGTPGRIAQKNFRQVAGDFQYLMPVACDTRRVMRDESAVSSEEPAFPAWRTFVVQFTRVSEGRPETFSGRVEHLSSGRRARFESPKELVATLRRLLDELSKAAR